MADVKAFVQQQINEHSVMVFSKSYCPYCVRVKQLFDQINVKYYAIELDQVDNGSEIQAALKELTNQSTVPNVFIGKKHVGGCDATTAAKSSGKLKELLTAAGVTGANL